MNRFKNVPVEQDTKIIFSQEAALGKYDILYQKWSWEAITAESIIFLDEDVSGLSDSEIEMEVKTSPLLRKDSSITLVRSESGFTFVNFNFKAE